MIFPNTEKYKFLQKYTLEESVYIYCLFPSLETCSESIWNFGLGFGVYKVYNELLFPVT